MDESSFSVETPEGSSGFLLWQVTVVWQREIKKGLEGVGLSHSAFVILASLLWFAEHDGEVTQTTIINHTKLDKMTVSKSLKTLCTDGFVLRSENEFDTRAKSIELTDVGRETAIKAVKIVENVDKEFFSRLTKEERATLNGLFVKLR